VTGGDGWRRGAGGGEGEGERNRGGGWRGGSAKEKRGLAGDGGCRGRVARSNEASHEFVNAPFSSRDNAKHAIIHFATSPPIINKSARTHSRAPLPHTCGPQVYMSVMQT
jgi:hypothetical protein